MLIVRRRFPVCTVAVTSLAAGIYYPLGYPDTPMGLAAGIALFTLAGQGRVTAAIVSAIVIVAGFLTSSAVRGHSRELDPNAIVDLESSIAVAALLLVIVAFGYAAHNRRAYTEAAEQRAAEAERSREEEALRRATEERLRIARELHDVLAHQISLINVQAGAALHRRDDPGRAYAALEAIKLASKDTLRELRGVLGVLRQLEEDQEGQGPAAPVPSLARLEDLLAHTSAAGLPARLAGQIPRDALPAPVELAAYRIVQEALTNAVRHAAATSATVEIRCSDEALVVQIDDDGRGPPGRAALERGNGLRGMRERAATVGGTVTAAAGPAGGFRVRARLPLDGPPAPSGGPSTGARHHEGAT